MDQLVARKIGSETRFRSLQIGVSQESFGSAMQKNMSGYRYWFHRRLDYRSLAKG